MSLAELTAAERHRRIANDFTAQVEQVTDWDAPTPVADWHARDVVEHLVWWLPGLLSGGGVDFPPAPRAVDDPPAAWRGHAATVQALLDDDDRAAAPFAHPHVGVMPAGAAIEVPTDADPQTRLLGFIGRQPTWRPDDRPARGEGGAPVGETSIRDRGS
jgi:hypothetical protein